MSDLIANLGMYDGGDLAAANDVLWNAIAKRLRAFGVRHVPRRLERDLPLDEIWSSDRLLFGQTCGYPLAATYRRQLSVIAAPRYAAPGCKKSRHRSFIIVNVGESVRDLLGLRGSRAVINEEHSMTGRHLLGHSIADVGGAYGFFASVAESGAHARSLAMVAEGEADVAAIDCVTYDHLSRSVPDLVARTRILHRTIATPTLPFVISTARGEATAALVGRALTEALADPATAEARTALGLEGTRTSSTSAYDDTLVIAAVADAVLKERVVPPPPPTTARSVALGA